MSEATNGQTPEPINVYGAIAQTVEFIASLAWQKMGLQPDIITGKIEPDMAQAKVAVDTVAMLVEILEPHLDEESDKRKVQNLVRDLRVNYVEKSGESK